MYVLILHKIDVQRSKFTILFKKIKTQTLSARLTNSKKRNKSRKRKRRSQGRSRATSYTVYLQHAHRCPDGTAALQEIPKNASWTAGLVTLIINFKGKKVAAPSRLLQLAFVATQFDATATQLQRIETREYAGLVICGSAFHFRNLPIPPNLRS